MPSRHRNNRVVHTRGRRTPATPHTDEFTGSVMEAGGNIRQAATSVMPAAREQIGRVGDRIAERAHSMEQSLTSLVRNKPVQSMFIAAGIGALVGLFLFRR